MKQEQFKPGISANFCTLFLRLYVGLQWQWFPLIRRFPNTTPSLSTSRTNLFAVVFLKNNKRIMNWNLRILREKELWLQGETYQIKSQN